MPTLVACLRRSVEAIQPRRVPTRFSPATRLRRRKSQRDQGPLATSQARMCPRTANSGLAIGLCVAATIALFVAMPARGYYAYLGVAPSELSAGLPAPVGPIGWVSQLDAVRSGALRVV